MAALQPSPASSVTGWSSPSDSGGVVGGSDWCRWARHSLRLSGSYSSASSKASPWRSRFPRGCPFARGGASRRRPDDLDSCARPWRWRRGGPPLAVAVGTAVGAHLLREPAVHPADAGPAGGRSVELGRGPRTPLTSRGRPAVRGLSGMAGLLTHVRRAPVIAPMLGSLWAVLARSPRRELRHPDPCFSPGSSAAGRLPQPMRPSH